MKRFYFLILLSLSVLGLHAREGTAIPSATLDALVQQALAENPELKFYEAELAAAKGERRSAGSWQNPEFSGEAGIKRLRGDGAAEGSLWAVSLSQPFEWPGRVALRKAIAGNQVDLAKNGLEQFRTALAAQVRQKGFALYVAQRREAASQEIAARGEELAATIVQRDPAGITPLLESRAIEASVIKMRHDAMEVGKQAESALYALNALRGRPITEPLRIEASTPAFPELPPIEELLHRAGRENFELRQRQIELRQQGFRVLLAKNEAWPSITLGSRVSQEKAGDESETTGGITLSVPLPILNRNQGAIETANARLVQAQASLQLMERDLERQLREQVGIYNRVRKELGRFNSQAIEQLSEAASLADRHYRLGAVPLSTYLEVQSSYLDAMEAIYDSQADALQAWTEIELLTGAPLAPTR